MPNAMPASQRFFVVGDFDEPREEIGSEQDAERGADVRRYVMAVREDRGGKAEEECRQERPPGSHEPPREEIDENDGEDREQYRHDPRRPDDRVRIIAGIVEELRSRLIPLAVDLVLPCRRGVRRKRSDSKRAPAASQAPSRAEDVRDSAGNRDCVRSRIPREYGPVRP